MINIEAEPPREVVEGWPFSNADRMYQSFALIHGVKLAPVDVAQLGYTAMLASALDRYVDDEGLSDINGFIARIKAGESIARRPEYNSQESVAFMLACLDGELGERYLEVARQLPEWANHKKEATTVDELTAVYLDEAEGYSSLFQLHIPHPDQDQQMKRDKLNNWIRISSKLGYLLDGLIDLGDDYYKGTTNVEPTLKNRLIMGRHVGSATLDLVLASPLMKLHRLNFVSAVKATSK